MAFPKTLGELGWCVYGGVDLPSQRLLGRSRMLDDVTKRGVADDHQIDVASGPQSHFLRIRSVDKPDIDAILQR